MKTTFTKKTQKLTDALKLLTAGALVFASLGSNAQTTTFNYTGSLQTYTVPVGVTSIRIDAQGAQGGSITVACAATGGLGARMVGDVTVTPGEVITVLVGGQGQTQGEDGGGGGGSFVVRTGNVPLVVAGGGGGATNNIQICTGLRNGVNASITTSGTASANGLVAGGTAGNGGGANVGSGCGGGGFYTDGGYAANMNGRGRAFVNGGAGGTGQNNNHGGYGGGGCGWYNGGNGGGGGGYSGGGTDGNYPSTYFGGGGGGGSYNIGTNQTNTAGFKTGNGLVEITVLNSLTATITQVGFIACNGDATGSLTAAPVGGTGPFTYSWAPSGGTNATASGLSAGTYTVTVTDASPSTTTQTFTITEPTLLTASTSSTPSACFGGADGTISVTPSGGTAPYSFMWSNGMTTQTGTGVVTGVYTCTVTCSNGCVTTASVAVTSPPQLVATSTSGTIACNGGTTTLSVTASGGTSPYVGEGTYTMTPAGTYTNTITDANGCSATTSVTITEPSAISTNVTWIDVTCNGGADGSIDLTVSGGTAPYTFDWNSGTYTTEDLTGLTAGNYVGVLTDANGCTDGGTITINEPSALVATLSILNDTTCSTDGAFTLTGESPAGGVFSGTGVSAGSFDPAVAGVGTHIITYVYTDTSGCTATTTDSIYVDVCTGTQFPVSGSAFSIYPNPNEGTFVLQTTSVADVMIYDAQGKLVYTQKVQPNVQNQMSVVESGMYMVTVITADGQRTSQRVMVTK